MSPTAEDSHGDPSVGTSYGMQLPTSPRKKAYSDLGDSGTGYQARTRCGRASSEFQRTPMVGQLPALHTQLHSGMVGGFPLGGIGQIPEGSAAQMGAAGQFVRAAPQFNGPVSRMIGPFPSQAAAAGAGVYTAPMQPPLSQDVGHMVGQYSQIGTLPAGYGVAGAYAGQAAGTYAAQAEDQLRRFSAPVGQATQLADARQLQAMRNSQSMNSAHMQAAAMPVIGAVEPARPVIGEMPSFTQGGSPGEAAQGTSLGLSQVELLQQLYAAHAADQQHQQQMASVSISGALLVPRQSQATSSVADMYSVVASEPSRYSSVQSFLPSQSDISKYSAQTTNLDSASHGGPSDPLEAPITESSSLESKPSTKVRVVCSSNGNFIRQPGGHFEYEGGDTRLVSVSNWFTLASLKEAMERVVVRPASSRSQSGPPDAMDLKYQLPSDPTVYVDLLDDEDVQLMFDEWADFAAQHKGTSYKLHVYVAWTKECCDDGRQTASISDDIGDAVSSGEVPATAHKEVFSVGQMAGRMEIISAHEISMAKFLGSGGYGEVYLGRWHSSEVAIKCLNPSLFFSGSDGSASKAAMADLMREADLLASLRHPNVVWVYGVVLPKMDTDEDGKLIMEDLEPIPMASGANLGRCSNLRPPAVVTEFMSQGSVKQALARKSDVVSGNMHRVVVAMDAAKGMEYLHQKSIVHFDLKSANLLLGYRDRRAVCKVSDFGLSKQKRDTYVSNVTSQRGTLPWIAPEIIKTPHAVTEKVDVYSFGVVLWELWTGREPYEGLNYHALLHQITLTGGGLRPTLPNSPKWEYDPIPEPAPGWCSLMERCWQTVPEKRPSFAEVVRELKGMGQALRPPRNRPNRSIVGASVSSSDLDLRGIPSGRAPTMGSPAKAMLPAAVGQMSQRQAMSRQAIPEDGEKGLEAAPSAQPGRPPVGGVPGNPLTAIKTLDVRQEVAAASSLVQPPPQPVAAKAPVNPFSSAFAYTERMNSAFTSGS
ncbi:hypothetical protein WJX75_001673 [Coccomyxa subellipsoidea]|uniref:Protein kinase domain-containing protein n=1 Tax=Coccomyxa subellipsoidea TaxID=248742 RepID=A0ABR2YDS3_9CHLO